MLTKIVLQSTVVKTLQQLFAVMDVTLKSAAEVFGLNKRYSLCPPSCTSCLKV